VEVSVLSNGTWSNFGSPCNITLPAAYLLSSEDDFVLINEKDDIAMHENNLGLSDLVNNSITLYPNPSNSSFKFSTAGLLIENESVEIMVMNSLGQIIEIVNFKTVDEIQDFTFGTNYIQGVYLVNIKTGSLQLQKRIVKIK